MYSQTNAAMAPPQKPETFLLSDAAQQSLPQDAQVALQQVDNLKYFLISAPVDWAQDQYIRRFLLPTGEYVSCVLWNGLFHISGTDIVRCLSFRFQAFGRPVKNAKKFEEGIFSDLRNLKSGTDASLEEPKSGFLDFMYKNNCIRTQKKQKVFYWYSVPHDRLFLDALERDLKREKMSQEPTTVAVNEPALSFEFDSSQSLFEQLTKAQQQNSSSFSANASSAYSQSTSPVLRATDSMPPPSLPQGVPAAVTDETAASMGAYSQVSMPSTAASNLVKREQEYGHMQYDRSGIPLNRIHQRHASMPSYIEYSPAPSFVSSQFEDYGSTRGISYEPVTPPQHGQGLNGDPTYIANEETGVYPGMQDVNGSQNYNNMMQLPAGNMGNGQFSGNRGYASNNSYNVIEGSPTYKQRRRRSSIPPGAAGAMPGANPHAPHRGSDLRRSVSVSLGPDEGDEGDQTSPATGALPNGYTNMVAQHKEMLDQMSRHGTPLQTVEDNQGPQHMGIVQSSETYSPYPGDPNAAAAQGLDMHGSMVNRGGDRAGPVRRARSATMMELGPYPHKSHSCPIPTCGRLFKRLEHLKRHVRTHTQERPYVCPHCSKAFSRSDNLAQHRRTHEARPEGEVVDEYDDDLEAEENEFGTMDDESPPAAAGEQDYMQSAMNPMVAGGQLRIPAAGMTSGVGAGHAMAPPMMSSQQLLQQQM